MKKLVVGVIGLIVFFNVQVFGAKVGDKIQFTKFNVLCGKYTQEHAKLWFVNLLKEGDPAYTEKVSQGNCMYLGISEKDNGIGRVVAKKYQKLTKKDFSSLKKDMKFEILKIDLLSVRGKKITSGSQVFWYAFPVDLPTYKKIK